MAAVGAFIVFLCSSLLYPALYVTSSQGVGTLRQTTLGRAGATAPARTRLETAKVWLIPVEWIEAGKKSVWRGRETMVWWKPKDGSGGFLRMHLNIYTRSAAHVKISPHGTAVGLAVMQEMHRDCASRSDYAALLSRDAWFVHRQIHHNIPTAKSSHTTRFAVAETL
ncbi:uncharacterized protein IWZ02DRAFT_70503 [Phyllosticta citriasiana]|uniref:uncharacterized protein n=1 Tax=Phyllosticta citriasiana TaxID=595635 RepID=UPI0030FD6DDF